MQDDFYDTPSSGTNTAKNSFTFTALSGFKTLTIGTREFTQSELESLSTTSVDISMQAGVLTLDSYAKIDNVTIITNTTQLKEIVVICYFVEKEKCS